MLLSWDDLPRYRHQVAMVDGGFDPLHKGHIEYFAAAAALGWPLLCNISSDAYVSTKHPPLLPQTHRVAIIDAIRYVTYTHASSTTTENVLRQLQPAAYVKGADWRGKLPPEQERIAEECGIAIVYLDTVSDSSRRILDQYVNTLADQKDRP